jgi:hypothetical protein
MGSFMESANVLPDTAERGRPAGLLELGFDVTDDVL